MNFFSNILICKHKHLLAYYRYSVDFLYLCTIPNFYYQFSGKGVKHDINKTRKDHVKQPFNLTVGELTHNLKIKSCFVFCHTGCVTIYQFHTCLDKGIKVSSIV